MHVTELFFMGPLIKTGCSYNSHATQRDKSKKWEKKYRVKKHAQFRCVNKYNTLAKWNSDTAVDAEYILFSETAEDMSGFPFCKFIVYKILQ